MTAPSPIRSIRWEGGKLSLLDQRKLPESLRILTQARNEVLRVLSDSDRRDQVYHLDISLIPLTEESHSREEEGSDG